MVGNIEGIEGIKIKMTSGLTSEISLRDEAANSTTASLSSNHGPWSDKAPKAIRKAARASQDENAWAAWQQHLLRRKAPRPLAKLLRINDIADLLSWSAKNAERANLPSGRAASASQSSSSSPLDATSPISLLKCFTAIHTAHLLPAASEFLSPSEWNQALQRLVDLVHEAERSAISVATLTGQLVRGELAITLAHLFPELTSCDELLEPARAALSAGVEELLDGEGVLHAKEWANMRPLLALWTRCRAIGGELKDNCWNEEVEAQFSWFVREVLRFTEVASQQLLGPVTVDDADNQTFGEILAAAVRLANDPEVRRVLSRQSERTVRDQLAREKGMPRAGVTSEWAEAALLRPWWSSDSPRLAVLYPNKQMQISLTLGKEMVCSGSFNPQIRLNGEVTQPISDWEEVCWFSDCDIDYLELEVVLDSGWRVQRHLLVGRQDPVMYIADALLGDRPAKIEYQCTLPLSPGVKFSAERETRDGVLQIGKSAAVVLPLALPEWRSDPRVGTLTQTEAGLELKQTAMGQGLLAPLWIDLNPRRTKLPRTWRQLTVGENRQIQRNDEAVGYRVQTGREQWLVYRSLRQPSNRTLLGHNLSSEFLIARFTTKGQVTALVEVE